MAVIGKIRSYSVLLVVVIGVALAAFVLGDLFQNRGRGRGDMPPLAEINGEEIHPAEFRNKVNEMEDRMRQQKQDDDLTSRERFEAMETAWNNLLMEEIMRDEYKEVGLAISRDRNKKASISSAELMELLTGENAHQYIGQIPAFQDEQTGQFRPEMVRRFISMLDQQDAETQRQWYELEQQVKKARLQDKYYNLIKKGYYLPQPMAEEFHRQETKTADVSLIGKRYREIHDSLITITEDDYASYYEDHKQEFKTKKPRAKIRYISYDVNPSQRDYRKIRQEAKGYFEELRAASKEEAGLIVNTIGQNDYDSAYYKQGELPARIDTALFDAQPGEMVDMYQEDGAFHMARLMDVEYRPDSMRASHILFTHQQAFRGEQAERDREEAEALADSVYEVVQEDPGKFEQLAATLSDDEASAANNGDLKWFSDGDMVYEFNEGVIRHDVGEIFKVETDFGFHVVQVTGKKEAVKMIRVARLRIPIEPTQQTYDSVWAQASQFAGSYRTREAFDEAVREQQLEPRERIIQPMENHIPGIGSPREMVRWAFDDKTKPGTVSEKVFEGENTYVVAVLEERSEAGIQPLENVKDEIEPLVGREVRARVLKEEFNKHMGENIRITELAHKLDAELDTLSGISFASPNIPGFGREPKLTGTIMSVEKNRLMGPLQGNMGVYAFAVQKIMPAPETDNFARIIQQKQNQFNSLVGGGQQGQVGQVFEALKEISEIEDNRILYY